MSRRLDQAEKDARKAVDDWMEQGAACAAYPGASLNMFLPDQQVLGRIADAFEVKPSPSAAWWSAYGLAWARCSLDATFGFNAMVMPWVSPDTRQSVLQKTNERFAEAAITAIRAKSKLQ